MYYVSKVVSYFGSYYGDIGINEANSSGATDIIVIEQPDGSLKSTPFHVRFGKLNLIRPKEVIVDILVNNEYVKDVEMRVEPTGQAYFEVQEKDRNGEELIPPNKDVQKASSCDPESVSVRIPRVHNNSSPTRLQRSVDNDNGYRSSDDASSPDTSIIADKREIFPNVKLSLCGNLSTLTYSNPASLETFYQSMVAYEDFYRNPINILNNPSLVILFEKQFLDWETFSVMAVAKLAFKQKIPSGTVQSMKKPKKEAPKSSSYTGWFLWRATTKSQSIDVKCEDVSSPNKANEEVTSNSKDDSSASYESLQVVYNSGRTRSLSGGDMISINNSQLESNETKNDKIKPESRIKKRHRARAKLKSMFRSSKTAVKDNYTYIRSGVHELKERGRERVNEYRNYNIRTETESFKTFDSNIIEEQHLKKENVINNDNNLQEPINNVDEIKNYSMDDSALHNPIGFIKTLTLPSDTLKLLKLKEGVNELCYVITGKYRGTIKLGCKVYYWKWTDKIVISDIDGTITKSDVWGHIGPMIGMDWTQNGVVSLYNAIDRNKYRFAYLSARSIGHADVTRNFLASVIQDEAHLPDGPVLLAPGSFFTAIKKELIERHPEEIKINTLNDVQSTYPPGINPLYAGFGNRPSDVMTYQSLNIPDKLIFTVNKYGQVTYTSDKSESTQTDTTNYAKLKEMVDELFPSSIVENDEI